GPVPASYAGRSASDILAPPRPRPAAGLHGFVYTRNRVASPPQEVAAAPRCPPRLSRTGLSEWRRNLASGRSSTLMRRVLTSVADASGVRVRRAAGGAGELGPAGRPSTG